MPPPLPPLKRVLVKISGEALMGPKAFGLHTETLIGIAQQIQALHHQGLEIAIVVGGGNIFRGVSEMAEGFHRAIADRMGMMATEMNGQALQSIFEGLGLETAVLSAVPSPAQPYTREAAIHALERKRIVICVAGTGNPYFTTDTAAVVRACEMDCDLLLKGTKVEGVFSADPALHPDAIFYPTLTYRQILTDHLQVMDLTAITLAAENQLPILVFSLKKEKGLEEALQGRGRFTLIQHEKKKKDSQHV